jgi:hypothetical protein
VSAVTGLNSTWTARPVGVSDTVVDIDIVNGHQGREPSTVVGRSSVEGIGAFGGRPRCGGG